MTDRAGRWFAALRAEGESVDIRYGFIPDGSATPSWTFLPHDRFDGMGGLLHLLRDAGVDVTPPVTRRRPPAPVLRSFRAFLGQRRRRPARWDMFDDDWRPRQPSRSRPVAVAWTILSESATSEVLRRADTCGVSLNSWLLWCLHQAIRDELDSDRGSAWMVPVNMRGAVRLRRDTANHLGFLIVPVRDDDRPRDVHQRVRHDLRRGIDVGSWYALAAGRSAGTRLLQDALAAGARRWRALGTVSNLGAWHLPQTVPSGAWLFCPPATRFQPLALGAVITGGRLALTMQSHPALNDEAAIVERWLRALETSIAIAPRPVPVVRRRPRVIVVRRP